LTPLAKQHRGHTASNISWITELGNRVQGEDAFDDIVDKIFMMSLYHKDRLGASWKDIEQRVRDVNQTKQVQ
jgi:hypothetical protein